MFNNKLYKIIIFTIFLIFSSSFLVGCDNNNDQEEKCKKECDAINRRSPGRCLGCLPTSSSKSSSIIGPEESPQPIIKEKK